MRRSLAASVTMLNTTCALTSKRGQVAFRQHRSQIVSQEIVDVLVTPNDAPHRENVQAWVSARGRPHPACRTHRIDIRSSR